MQVSGASAAPREGQADVAQVGYVLGWAGCSQADVSCRLRGCGAQLSPPSRLPCARRSRGCSGCFAVLLIQSSCQTTPSISFEAAFYFRSDTNPSRWGSVNLMVINMPLNFPQQKRWKSLMNCGAVWKGSSLVVYCAVTQRLSTNMWR